MITQIELENFKVFKEKTSFILGPITLLTGINGCGKSTLLQSLLLMRQSIEHNDSASQVVLNGSCVNLGSFTDIKNSSISRNEPIKFIYHYDDQHILNPNQDNTLTLHGYAEYDFEENFEDDMVAQISNIAFSDQGIINFNRKKSDYGFEGVYKNIKGSNTLNLNRFDFDERNTGELPGLVPERTGTCRLLNLLPFSGGGYDMETPEQYELSLDVYSLHKSLHFYKIHYISADRLGPQESYSKATLNKFPNAGAKGEFTVNLLYKRRDDLINEKLCLGQDAKTLYTQTEEWLNNIFNGAKVEIPSSDSNILELLFNTNNSKDRFKPANVGFGYHCVLPIVVSGLIAKEGEILIVENPEAHLHPRAQSRLAQFLARVSSCGVQVFIESHSDHILNALRIAVLDKIVTPENLSILYFQPNPEQPVLQIPVQPDGGIEEWPEGFFDQMDKDFSRLFGM
jgi:predicted ATPase